MSPHKVFSPPQTCQIRGQTRGLLQIIFFPGGFFAQDSEIDHPACYIAGMIRSFILCATLVASSAAGAVALSVVHGAAFEMEVGNFAAPELEPSFVIPAFAPSTLQSVSGSVASMAQDAPVQERADPVVEPVLAALGSPADSMEVIGPDAGVAPLRVPAKAVVERPRPNPQIVQAPRIVPQVAQEMARPVSRVTVVEPKYYIGVYR